MINRGCCTWTGQMSSQARQVQQAQSSSGRNRVAMQRGWLAVGLGRRPQQLGIDGLDDIARREGKARVMAGADLLAFAAPRAGVHLEKLPPREVAHGTDARFGHDRQPAWNSRRAQQHVDRRGDQVKGLGEGDAHDQTERQERVQPPEQLMQAANRIDRQPRQDFCRGVANRSGGGRGKHRAPGGNPVQLLVLTLPPHAEPLAEAHRRRACPAARRSPAPRPVPRCESPPPTATLRRESPSRRSTATAAETGTRPRS